MPRHCCWSSLVSLLGAGSLPLPAGCLPDPGRSLHSVWKPPFKTGFFGFRLLFFPNENNPHPVNHHLGWFFFSHYVQVLPKKSLESCQPHKAEPNVHMHQPVWARMSGTVSVFAILHRWMCINRTENTRIPFQNMLKCWRYLVSFPVVEKGLCCIRNWIRGWCQLDACFGQLLVFCRMNRMGLGERGNMMDSQSKPPLMLVTVLYVQFSLLSIHLFSLTWS